MTVKIAITTRETKAQLTRKDRNGSLKTKKPTFLWNWGSAGPANDPPLLKSRKLRHCPMAPEAAIRATTTETTLRTSTARGATRCW